MRIRSIKPDFWTDEKMSALHPETVLLAIGLQNCADDEGFFNANWRLLLASIFPLRNLSKKVPVMLHELSHSGYLTYVPTADGRVLGRLLAFKEMQVISHARPSELRKVFETSIASPVEFPEASGLIPAGLEGKGREGKGVGLWLGGGGGKGVGTSPDGDGPLSAPTASQIYDAYPRKVNRPDAIRAIEKALEFQGRFWAPEFVLERTQAYAAAVASWPADFRYTRGGADTVPHPATWFNGHRFADDEAGWRPGKISSGARRGAVSEPFNADAPNAHTGGMVIVNPPEVVAGIDDTNDKLRDGATERRPSSQET